MTPQQVLNLYPLHNYTLPSLIDSRVAVAGDREAFSFQARSWTYKEFASGIEALAQRLAAIGISKGDRVSHIAPNSDLAIVLFLALSRIRAIFVPMNVELSDNDLSYMLRNSGAKLIFCEQSDEMRMRTLATQLETTASVLTLEDIGANTQSASQAIETIRPPLSETRAATLPTPLADDPCFVIYTSGTTGFPKGVLHSHKTYILSAEAFVQRLHLQPGERLLTVFPFFHGNAMFYTVGGALACGGTAITAKRFSASGFWKLAVESKATQLNILAALGNILMLRPRSEFDSRHQIRKIYGGPISEEMFRVFRDEFNVPHLIEGYGMSEIPATCSNPFDGVHKLNSIGLPCKHPTYPGTFTEVMIADDDGNSVPQGTIGELVVRTPTLFKGYLNDPTQTEAAFRGGWFLTGDLASIDEDGYLFFSARKKDIIRRRGENISGAELDRILSEHPGIAEAATIGVPAELGEEELLAVLVAKPGCTPTFEEILEWSRKQLAAIKVPRYMIFVDGLPHTPTHRIAKHLLKRDATLRDRAFDSEARLAP